MTFRTALRPSFLSKPAPRLAAPATLALLALSLAAFLFPELTLALQFDRTQIAAGQYWRVLTGHMTHWTAGHLFWDAAMFLALGIMLERSGRGRFVACLLASALAISAGVWFLQPELATYRGLSGLDTALFAMLAVELIGVSRRRRDLLVPVLLLAGLSGKLAFELTTGATVFVNSGEAFVPVPVAHSIGALVGAALGAMGVRRTD